MSVGGAMLKFHQRLRNMKVGGDGGVKFRGDGGVQFRGDGGVIFSGTVG